jgi:hypothetical protein
MKEKHPDGPSPLMGDDHSTDTEFFPPFMEDESLFESGYPASWRLALWLDFFLRAGEEAFKEKWTSLSSEEQKTLGIELLKCYLVQPLFLRFFAADKPPTAKGPFILKKDGKLLQVTYDTGKGESVLLLYPLVHHRLWPGLLSVFKEVFPYSHTLLKHLEPELRMAAASRLEEIRQRAETLRAYDSKEAVEDVLHSHDSGQELEVIKETVFSLEKVEPSDLDQADISPSTVMDAVPSAPEIPDIGFEPQRAPKKRKKKKSAEDQMKLF